jgi:hypothetical protein
MSGKVESGRTPPGVGDVCAVSARAATGSAVKQPRTPAQRSWTSLWDMISSLEELPTGVHRLFQQEGLRCASPPPAPASAPGLVPAVIDRVVLHLLELFLRDAKVLGRISPIGPDAVVGGWGRGVEFQVHRR